MANESQKAKLHEMRRKIREAERLAGIGNREKMAAKRRDESTSAMDIGDIPPRNMVAVIDGINRRDACEFNLQLFLETYFGDTFYLAWSQDQRDIIATTQMILLDGGQSASAIYRAGGKTSICERAAIWAELYGHRRFVPVVGQTGPASTEILAEIQLELETNDLLFEDFPEAIHPIRALEGESRRCKRQTYNGKRTRIEWGADGVVFATIPGAKCSGAILKTASIDAARRGWKHLGIRPDAVLADDLQTDESAASPLQVAKRLRILTRTILKWAGPKKRIACMVPCTIIFPGDLADQITNRERHPEFNGERRKLVHKFPTNKEWWEEYRNVRAEGLRKGDNGRAAHDFYIANQKVADEGAVIAWPEYTKGKASAVQYVMDEFIDDPDGASAELNNEPKYAALMTDLRQLTEDDLAKKLNTLPLGLVPRDCEKLTAFIDVQQECLFWMVCGWSAKFGGAVIDYGTFPEQPGGIIFEVSRLPRPLSVVYGKHEPKLDLAARHYKALSVVIPALSGRAYRQQDKDGTMTLSLGMIDAGKWTDTVHDFLGRSQFKALWRASKGKSVMAGDKLMNDYKKDPGDFMGWNCRIDAATTAKGRFVSYDTLAWKTRIATGLLDSPGSATSIYLPGKELREHPLLITQLLSEYRDRMTSLRTGRTVETWRVRPDNKENHLWDCLIGCAVAANVNGLQFSAAASAGENTAPGPAGPRLSFSEQQKQKQASPGRLSFSERQRLKREAMER